MRVCLVSFIEYKGNYENLVVLLVYRVLPGSALTLYNAA